MLAGVTIERIPRLTPRMLHQLIVRMEALPYVPACYKCETPTPNLLPVHGEILCPECAAFKTMGITIR